MECKGEKHKAKEGKAGKGSELEGKENPWKAKPEIANS